MKKRTQKHLAKLELKLRTPVFFLFALLAITAFLEIFLFNFRYFTTLASNPIELTNQSAVYGDGLRHNADGTIDILADGEKTIEFTEINAKINSIYVDIENTNDDNLSQWTNDGRQIVSVSVLVTDEANKLYYILPPDRSVNRASEKSKYLNIYTFGTSNSVKIQLNEDEGENLLLKAITLNPRRPFFFVPIRCLITYAVLFLFAASGSERFNKYAYDSKSPRQRIITAALAAVIMVMCVLTVRANTFWFYNHGPTNQYNLLADALLDGHAYLDGEPSQELAGMDNPYDTEYRRALLDDEEFTYRWDTAYYNGKYYTYFGVVPAILLNIPHKLISGEDISNDTIVLRFCLLFIVSAFLLVGAIVKRWYSSTPYFLYLILTLSFIMISGVLILMSKPSIYEAAISSGLAFITLGLYFWISAGYGARQTLKLCLGSLCVALTAGCRPQFTLAAVLAVPLLWPALIPNEKRKGAWRERMPAVASFCFPFIVIAILLMYYNYIRFESVFDFGATYNLTVNDMTKRGFVAARIPHAIWKFFFQPANLTLQFPYFHATSNYTGFMIRTVAELTYGGAFNYIFLLCGLLIFKYRKQLKQRSLFAFSAICLFLAFFTGVLDAQVAGISHRYFADFTYLLFLPALAAALFLYEISSAKRRKYLRIFICFGLVTGICFSILPLAKEHWLMLWNGQEPNVFYAIQNAIEFWQ